MSIYHLLDNATVVGASPTLGLPPNSIITQEQQYSNGSPPVVSLTATLTGIGSCSATVQPIVSNDRVNWYALSPIIVTATSADLAPGINTDSCNVPYAYWAAYVSAISGTNAAATLLMAG